MQPTPQKPKIEPLTSARFFAALLVVLYHTLSGKIRTTSSPFLKVIGIGYISVSFFFMLSGFILAVVYLGKDKPVDTRRFLIARFARIYPLYLAAMLLDLPHYLYTSHHFHASVTRIAAEILATAGLLQAWFNLRGINTPGWSLSTEAFFYVIFPAVGVFLWRLKNSRALIAAITIYVAGVALLYALFGPSELHDQGYFPIPHTFVFLLGILLARYFVRVTGNPARHRRLKALAPAMLFTALVLVVLIANSPLVRQAALLQHGLLAPLFAVAILALASGNPTIHRLFSASWLVLLGEASYALYLLHYPMYSILRRFVENGGWIAYILYLAGALALSIVSFLYLEGPARRWILNRARVRSLESLVTSSISQ